MCVRDSKLKAHKQLKAQNSQRSNVKTVQSSKKPAKAKASQSPLKQQKAKPHYRR
jgi:hypothetical protein